VLSRRGRWHARRPSQRGDRRLSAVHTKDAKIKVPATMNSKNVWTDRNAPPPGSDIFLLRRPRRPLFDPDDHLVDNLAILHDGRR
jgi:hypothetical protein